MKARIFIAGCMAISAVSLAALFYLLPPSVRSWHETQEHGRVHAAQKTTENTDLEQSFFQAANAVKVSVVSIQSVSHRQMSGWNGNEFGLKEFEPFFDNHFLKRFMPDPLPQQNPHWNFEQRGLGSGIIVDTRGYILTNDHVVNGAEKVTVQLSNNKEYTGKIIGSDSKADLAVVKIEADGLTAAKLGDSDQTQVGQWVLAMGNPFGLSQTLTHGIISAKGRANVGIADFEDFIQTDAAINPGNSGGPLINLKGEVIGINTAIATNTSSFNGVGFAIPSNMAKSEMDSLIKTGHVDRGWLGVSIQNLTPDLAKSFSYKGTDGVLVGDVTPKSPADKAGFKSGDIVTSYDGKDVSNVTQFQHDVVLTHPGTKASIEVMRGGKKVALIPEIGVVEAKTVNVPNAEPATSSKELGMEVKKSPNVIEVDSVQPNSLAEMVGLQKGDLIESVGDKPVDSVNAFQKEIQKQDLKNGVRLQVKSGDMSRFLYLKSNQ